MSSNLYPERAVPAAPRRLRQLHHGRWTVVAACALWLLAASPTRAQGLPAAPELPATPAAPAVPAAPAAPAAPTMPAAPTVPAAPAAPGAPATPAAPAQDTGETFESPDVPGATDDGPFTDQRPPELWDPDKQDAYNRGGDDEERELTVEALVNAMVVSASNRAESSLTAPAWIITLTQQDLLDRGYVELTELLDDLPSMDIVRPYGADYLKNYWRGNRNITAAPFLFMVDGVILNSLGRHDIEVMGAFPLSAIDRVEIVYGPASAVYGGDATMGLINVITNRGGDQKGVHTDTRITLGSPKRFGFGNMTKIADSSVRFNGEGYRVLGSVRFELGELDPDIGEHFEWTRNEYYGGDHWAAYRDVEGNDASFRSRDEKSGISLRLLLGEHAACGDLNVPAGRGRCTEFAVQQYRVTTGYGVEYPAPIVQTNVLWAYLEQGGYVRHVQDLSSQLSSETRVRFRASNVEPESQFVFYGGGDVSASTWSSRSNAWSVQQDFNIDAGQNVLAREDRLGFKSGFRYQRMDLERGFVVQPASLPGSGAMLTPAVDELPARPNIDAAGAYLLGTYSLEEQHHINLGVRLDYSQILKSVMPTFRMGYVGRFTPELTVKAMYGQAFQERAPFYQYSEAYDGRAQRDPDPEQSQTFELSLNYTQKYLGLRAGGYFIDTQDAVVADSEGLIGNVDSRSVAGADLGLQAMIPLDGIERLSFWTYYSPILLAERPGVRAGGVAPERCTAETVQVGDLALHKVLGGITLEASESFLVSVIGRVIGPRQTVCSNPIEEVDGYFTADAHVKFRNVFTRGLSLGIRATNLLDATYFHPGIREANSGEDPSNFTDDGVWQNGSFYNSLMPQPGREIFATLSLTL